MANFVFNVAKGRCNELYNRVDSNDPANSVIVVVAINTSATDATLQDLDTLSAVLADADTNEESNGSYARKVLTDTDVAALAPDDTNDEQGFTLPDQTWTSVTTSITSWTDILVCYDNDSTGGTDANIIPISCHDFVVTPNGGDITADFPAVDTVKAT